MITSFEPSNDQISQVMLIIYSLASIYGISISTMTLVHIQKKLRLNKAIKMILALMTWGCLISSTFQFLHLLLFQARGGYFTIFDCWLGTLAMIVMPCFWNLMNMISILRYQMSYKASKARIISKTKAVFIIVLISILDISSTISVLVYLDYSMVRSAVAFCMNEMHLALPPPILPTLVIVKLLSFGSLGVFSDVSLYQFIKKRQEAEKLANQTGLVPWKTMAAVSKSEDELQVPLRATILSIAFIFISIIAVGITFYFTKTEMQSNTSFWLLSTSLVIITSTLPAVMVEITIKDQSTKNNNSAQNQPPTQLQFHDDGLFGIEGSYMSDNHETSHDSRFNGTTVESQGNNDLRFELQLDSISNLPGFIEMNEARISESVMNA